MIQSSSYCEDLKSLSILSSLQYKYEKWKKKAIEEVSQNGHALKYGSEWWARESEIVAAAIRKNPLAIRYAPLFQNDKAMAMLAVKINGLARFWLHANLQEDQEICKAANENFPTTLDFPEIFPLNWYSSDRIFSSIWNIYPEVNQLRNIYNEIVCIRLENIQCSPFLRDSHVTLFNGGHLLPYSIHHPLLDNLLMSILPSSANHFLIDEITGSIENDAMGKGFERWNVEQAMITAYDFNIPFKKGKTCIEGGNCYLFMSKNERKAIVGELSLYLSLIALEEQGYFEERLVESITQPSLEAYKIARNLMLYYNKRKPIEEKKYQDYLRESAQKKYCLNSLDTVINPEVENFLLATEKKECLEECIGEVSYRKLLMTPVSDNEQMQFLEEARVIEAKLRLTKACIAAELEVSLENIAFVPQTMFHIDMEMFITPTGKVILHDAQKALEFLEEIECHENLNDGEKKLFAQYQKSAKENFATFQVLQEKRIEILKKIDVDIHLLPAVFEAPFKSTLNYCNGIFAKNKRYVVDYLSDSTPAANVFKERKFTYITTGLSFKEEDKFHRRFLQIFNNSFPDFTVLTIPRMSNFIAKYQGGIHCLTFESSLLFDI